MDGIAGTSGFEPRAPLERATRRRWASLALALGLGALASCGDGGRDGGARPRLVVLYATCTLNKSFLGAYSDDVAFTPNLDRFAEEGVVFERHETETGQSGIAYASLVTGAQADRHHVYYHPTQLDESLYLVTEAFADAGYEPFFWRGHELASDLLGYAQGVPEENVYVLVGPNRRKKKLGMLQRGDAKFEAIVERVASDPDYRAFVLLEFTTTHRVYHKQLPKSEYARFLEEHPEASQGLALADLEEQWALVEPNATALQWDFDGTIERLGLDEDGARELVAAMEVTYAADVAALDRMFGGMLDLLRGEGVLDESLIAFTADHGETLAREGTRYKFSHGLQLAPEVLGVPWILRSGQHSFVSSRFAPATASIDVYPTLAGLCGIATREGVEGLSHAAALLGTAEPVERPVYSHTQTIGPTQQQEYARWPRIVAHFPDGDPEHVWVRVREGDLVLKIGRDDAGAWYLRAFDLATDPLELHDVFDPSDPTHAHLAEALEGYKRHLVDTFEAGASPSDAYELLKGLGYVGGDE